MRFTPYQRPPERAVTPQRLSLAAKAVGKERARAGMFAGQFVTETPGERLARLDDGVVQGVRAMRDRHARMWRRGRRALHALPCERGRQLLGEWNHGFLPGSPEYFLDFLRQRGVQVPNDEPDSRAKEEEMPQTKKKRQPAGDAPGPPETPSPEGGTDVEEVDAQGNPIEGAHRPTPTWTKVVLQVDGNTAAIGVQDEGCDPAIYVVNATLAEALDQVPEMVERARLQWADQPQYPAYNRPAPPPAPPRPAKVGANAKQPAAPAPKSKQPAGQKQLF